MIMQLLKNRESGQAMIMVLALLVLGGLLIAPILNLTSTSLGYHRMVEKSAQGNYAADSGVRYALCELGNSRGAFGPESLSSEVNGRTVNVTVEDMGEDVYKITSTATADDGSSTAIESYVWLRHFTIASTDDDGLITIRHDAVVNGDVFYSGQLEILDNATVNGEIMEAAPLDIGINPEEYKIEAQSGGTHSGDLTIDSSPYSLGPLYITGKLTIQNGKSVVLGGTVYAEKNIVIGDDVTITGTGNLLTANLNGEGKAIEFKKRVTITPDNVPLIMSASSSYAEIKIGDQADITGLLYAPDGKIHFHAQGPANVYGALIGEDIRVCEDATITYNPDLDISGLYALLIISWQVN